MIDHGSGTGFAVAAAERGGMKAMGILLRSTIALSAVAVLWTGAAYAALATKTFAHDTGADSSVDNMGFLDFKTFLIGPDGGDDPALTSERLRFVSPETILFDRARNRQLDPPRDFPDLRSTVLSKQPVPDRGADELTIEVNGAPVTLSLGLRDAILRDLRENFGLYGVPGLFNPMPGSGSAGYFEKAVRDVVRRIDAMEDALKNGSLADAPGKARGGAMTMPEPSSLSILAFGLLAMVWVRRSRGRQRR